MQKLINKQARVIIGLFKITLIQFLQKEANLPDAAGLLDIRRLEMVLRYLR